MNSKGWTVFIQYILVDDRVLQDWWNITPTTSGLVNLFVLLTGKNNIPDSADQLFHWYHINLDYLEVRLLITQEDVCKHWTHLLTYKIMGKKSSSLVTLGHPKALITSACTKAYSTFSRVSLKKITRAILIMSAMVVFNYSMGCTTVRVRNNIT